MELFRCLRIINKMKNPVLLKFIQGDTSITYMIYETTSSLGACYAVKDMEGYFFTFMEAVSVCSGDFQANFIKR